MKGTASSSKLERAAVTSLLVGSAVFALKMGAASTSGSAALLSDALESIVNLVTAAIAIVALRVAARPPDANHPFGHGKVEYFSAGFEGGLVCLAAATIVHHVAGRFGVAPVVPRLGLGVGLNAAALVLNAGLARHLIGVGRRLGSPALTADGIHVRSDVISSIAVLVGIVAAWATKLWILDSLLALAVAVHILWLGFQTLRDSFSGLMDAALDDSDVATIQTVIDEEKGDALEIHDLRTRRSGRARFVEFHLVVPGSTAVRDAHGLCDRIESRLHARFPHLHVAIHVEPEGEALGSKRVSGT